MNEVSTPRAKLVELLWQLKQQYDLQEAGRSIHFNTLLRDSDYRREVIDEAAQSPNRNIRDLGRSLRVLNADGELTQTRFAHDDSVNPDIVETLGLKRDSGATSKKGLSSLFIGAVVVLLILGAGLATLQMSGEREVLVSGSLDGEHTWTADKTWLLDGIVYLEAGAKLNIEPGTRIQGGEGAALVATRYATLYARGTAAAPIVFTSNKPVGQRQAGNWGGLVLLGNAPVNVRGAKIEGVPQGDSRASFGGSDPGDNCGVLEFVRIEFAGYEVYANNELNGLTLGGCGTGTIVRNVQVHRASDDGIEIFGGDVDLKNIVITGAADDSLDWDMGWRGRVQFLQVLQYPNSGDNAFEADNREVQHDATPVSEPQIYNASLLSLRSGEKYQRAMTLRRGTGGHFHNMIVSGFSGEAIDIKDVATVQRIRDGQLEFSGVLISDIGASGSDYFADESGDKDDDAGFDEMAFFARHAQLGSGLGLAANTALDRPKFGVDASSLAASIAVSIPEGEFWDEAANYSGAVKPGSTISWMDGWTDYPLN